MGNDLPLLHGLALFGGRPAFAEPLHVGRPNIGNRERLHERLTEILDRRWLSNDGPCVQEFEERIRTDTRTRHCVAVANATVGLEIAARALNLTQEVIVPAFTFVASAHALQWLGLTPVFCDVDPRTHLIDPEQVEALITPRTSGILGVHLWGNLCDVGALTSIADRHGLQLFFDAAHAYQCGRAGKPTGGNGALEVFSFHATKFANAFEGGAITTNSAEIAHRLRLMRNFGFETYDTVVSAGTNGKMSEIAAAMGLTSLEATQDFVTLNRSHWHTYRERLDGLPGFRFLDVDPEGHSNYQYVVLEVDAAEAGLQRDDLLRFLWSENVRARRYFYPGCHRMEPYRTLFPDASQRLPVTERIAQRVLVLPTGTGVTGDQVERICELVTLALAHSGEIRARLEATA